MKDNFFGNAYYHINSESYDKQEVERYLWHRYKTLYNEYLELIAQYPKIRTQIAQLEGEIDILNKAKNILESDLASDEEKQNILSQVLGI